MKRPLIIAVLIVLGIVATNALVSTKTTIADQTVEDSIDTSQAAPREISTDIPL